MDGKSHATVPTLHHISALKTVLSYIDPCSHCRMTSDHFFVHVSAHPQLKLHSIAPVTLPPRYTRGRDPSYRKESRANDPPFGHGAGQNRAVDVSHRGRSDTFVASNSSIFSSPVRQVVHGGSIPVHRAAKRTPESGLVQRDLRRRARADPIAFDPFSDSPYYVWLTQDPVSSTASKQFRRDSANLRGFREWVTAKFPKIVAALKSLHMLHDRPPPANFPSPAIDGVNREGRARDALEDSASDDEEAKSSVPETSDDGRVARRRLLVQQREAQHQAWGILFESARLLSIPPGDMFVTQDSTSARDVFFILSGQCQLLFQPKFLDSVVQARNAVHLNTASRKAASQTLPNRTKGPQESSSETLVDPTDLQSSLNALLAMRRLSLSMLTAAEATEATARAVYPLQVLSYGDFFGVEACMFRFPHHCVSAVSQGALQRNAIGVATPACLQVLVLPFHALERMRSLIHNTRQLSTEPVSTPKLSSAAVEESLLAPRRRTKRPGKESKTSPEKQTLANLPAALPGCDFREEDVEFLHHTFMLQSIHVKRLQYLATQVRLIRVPQHEYLFTTGQDVVVYLVKSGQLHVFSPEQVRIHTTDDDEHKLRDAAEGLQGMAGDGCTDSRLPLTTVETRHVELEILQIHDMIGLMEASLLQSTFSNYCIAASTDVWVYAIPPVALFTVLAHEPTASQHAIENLLYHHSWYKARKFTALNHHNKQTEFRLSLGAQRKSPIPCSRCGWSGHTSTSSMCVRAASPKSAFIEHLLGKDEPSCLGAPPQASSPSLRSRVERVSQLRLAHANRTGSVALVPSVDTVAHSSGPRTGSLVVGRVGGVKPSTGSLLPGLADLELLLKGSQLTEAEPEAMSNVKSDVEKALDRLDAALQEEEHMPIISPRPKTQQLQRRRPGELKPEAARGSVFDLREEAVKVVARIGTATTASFHPRAAVRRRAIEGGNTLSGG